MAFSIGTSIVSIFKKLELVLRIPIVFAIDSVISSPHVFNSVGSFVHHVLPALCLLIPLLFVDNECLAFTYGYFISLDIITIITFLTAGAKYSGVREFIIEKDNKLLLSDGLLCYLIILALLGTIGPIFDVPRLPLVATSIALSVVLGNYRFGWITGILFYKASKISGVHDNLKESLADAVFLVQEVGIVRLLIYQYRIRRISSVLRIFWLLITVFKLTLEKNAPQNMHWTLDTMALLCNTRLRLLGMSMWLPELSYFILWVSRGFLNWTVNHSADDLESRDWSKALVFYFVANSFKALDVVHKSFFLILLTFISVSFILQSAVKLTDDTLKALSTSIQNRYAAHARAVSLMLFLVWIFLYTSYKFCFLFSFHVWQLVIVSSNIVIAIQGLTSLVVYALFVYDLYTSRNLADLDEWVYYITALSNSLEFLSAVLVFGYTLWNAVHGSWNFLGLLLIIFHAYYNLWLRATEAWTIFLRRRSAVIKLSCLTDATQEDLDKLQDLCPICFDSMTSETKITHCGHYFHSNCLRKWLYVQSSCPLCHQDVLVDKNKED